jgi:transposase-like protein
MADVLAVRDEYRLQNWTQIIRERQESGLTNKEFCTQRGIPEKKYYYWLRKVREAAAEATEPQLVRLDESSESPKRQRIEIRYGEAELKLPEDVDLKAVAVLLNALRRHD